MKIIQTIFVLNPTAGEVKLPTLGLESKYAPKKIQFIKMIGSEEDIEFSQTGEELTIVVPEDRPNPYSAVFEVKGAL